MGRLTRGGRALLAIAATFAVAPSAAFAANWSTLQPGGAGKYVTSDGFVVPKLPQPLNAGQSSVVAEGGTRQLSAIGRCCVHHDDIVVRTLVNGRSKGEVQILRPLGQLNDGPDVAVGPRGKAVVIWSVCRESDDPPCHIVAAFRSGPGRTFGAPHRIAHSGFDGITGEGLFVLYDGARVTAVWMDEASFVIHYAQATSGHFGQVRSFSASSDLATTSILGLFVSDEGPLLAWQAIGQHEFASSDFGVRVLAPGGTTYTDGLGENDPGFDSVTVGGSQLIAVRGIPATATTCNDDIQVLRWDPVGGFTAPRDVGPAGGKVQTMSAAVTREGLVAVAWDAAPPDARCDAFTGDVVQAMTLKLSDGTTTPAATLSPSALPPNCGGPGCVRWKVTAATFGADPIVTWAPTRHNRLAGGSAIYR